MEVVSTGGLSANLSRADFFRGISKPVNEELTRLFIRLDLMEQTGYGIPRITQNYGQDAFEFLDFFLRVTIRFAFEIDADAIGNEPTNAQIGSNEPINEPTNAQTSSNEPINEPTNAQTGSNEPISEPTNAQTSNNEPINEPTNAQTDNNNPINEPINAQTSNYEPIKHILDIISAYPNMPKELIAERIGKSRATVTRLLGVLIGQGKIRRVGANKNGHWKVL